MQLESSWSAVAHNDGRVAELPPSRAERRESSGWQSHRGSRWSNGQWQSHRQAGRRESSGWPSRRGHRRADGRWQSHRSSTGGRAQGQRQITRTEGQPQAGRKAEGEKPTETAETEEKPTATAAGVCNGRCGKAAIRGPKVASMEIECSSSSLMSLQEKGKVVMDLTTGASAPTPIPEEKTSNSQQQQQQPQHKQQQKNKIETEEEMQCESGERKW